MLHINVWRFATNTWNRFHQRSLQHAESVKSRHSLRCYAKSFDWKHPACWKSTSVEISTSTQREKLRLRPQGRSKNGTAFFTWFTHGLPMVYPPNKCERETSHWYVLIHWNMRVLPLSDTLVFEGKRWTRSLVGWFWTGYKVEPSFDGKVALFL